MPAPKVPQRVALLYRGVRPGVELLALLGEDRAVNVIKAPLELSRGGPPADVVIVDVPAEDRRAVCEQVRHHHRGPLIVLLHPADNSLDLPPDRSRTLLTRPFSLRELVVAVGASAPSPPASDPAGRPGLLLPHGAQDRTASPDWDNGPSTVAQAVPRLGRSWRERRLVRVVAILIPAALAFIGAFGLADESDRCLPRCDELTGADDLTSPSGTTVQAVGVGPETIDSGVGVAGPTTTVSSVGPTAVGGSRTDAPTSGPTRIATTTSWSSRVPNPTSPPGATRPQPSASSTTAPTTTRPRPSTTTTTTSSTTTTTDPSTSGTRPFGLARAPNPA
jgi:hypothetical protein